MIPFAFRGGNIGATISDFHRNCDDLGGLGGKLPNYSSELDWREGKVFKPAKDMRIEASFWNERARCVAGIGSHFGATGIALMTHLIVVEGSCVQQKRLSW